MKVSVLVTTYNLENYIAETLDSILEQVTDFSFEILVGDDGSADRTVEIIRKYQQQYPERIRLFQMPREEGVAYNRVERSAANRLNLLKEARGEYCTFLDGDDYYLSKDRLQRMVNILELPENHDCVMCAHNLLLTYSDGTKVPLTRIKKEHKFSMGQYWKLTFIQSNAILFRNQYKTNPPTGNCARYFDDNNITYWLFQMGKMYYLPECMGAYRQVADSSWNAIDHLKKSASNMIGYSVELELNPKGRRLSDIRHFPDYAFLFRHRKEMNEKSCAPFYETAVKNDVTEALKVYHMGESRGLQYFGFVWRYFTGWTGYVLAKMGRAIDKLTGNY